MKKLLTAIALTIALPAVAHAKAAPAPKADCSEKMKDMKACCGKDMTMMGKGMSGMKAGADMPAGHDMSRSGAMAPAADAHQTHQQ